MHWYSRHVIEAGATISERKRGREDEDEEEEEEEEDDKQCVRRREGGKEGRRTAQALGCP